ncbi:unnamed protein product [Urochloa humidicola]
MLTAVGIDPNDCIFSIAFAVVEVESLITWKWFLNTLKEDLGIENTFSWTIMTDKQKGLIPAVGQVFPESEHRFCVRHLYSNFQQHFKCENLKNQLWSCARSTTVTKWNENMDKMKTLNLKAYQWLEKMDPRTWVRAFFSTYSKCDILLNNSCEVFNSYILEAREMPILTMLQQVKTQLMTRHYNKEKEVGEQWDGPICPKIRKKLNKNIELANTCYAQPTGKGVFQVQVIDRQYIVDIQAKTCDCRRWDLTGIPCSHAITCLRHERISPQLVVNDCYSTKSYLLAYGPKIWPCNDQSMWQKVDGLEILPPVYEKKVGRPPKNRRKQSQEVQGHDGTRMSRHGTIITCSYCGESGHNRGGCNMRKAEIKPNLQTQHEDPQLDLHEEEYVDDGVSMHFEQGTEPSLLSQLTETMISQLDAESTRISTRQSQSGPLLDSTFIMSNLPNMSRPMAPTTATKYGRGKRAKKTSTDEAPIAKKKKASTVAQPKKASTTA